MSSVFSSLSLEGSTYNPDAAASGSKSTGPKPFRPGQYEVKITEVMEPRPDKRDPSWQRFLIIFTDVEGQRRGSTQVVVPTVSLAHAGDEKGFTQARLRRVLQALGREGSDASLKQDLERTFGKPERGLVGQTMQVKLGYRAYHTRYSKEHSATLLLDKNGNAVADSSTNEPLTFSSREEAEAYAKAKNLFFDDFVDVLEFVKKEVETIPAASKPKWGGLSAAK